MRQIGTSKASAEWCCDYWGVTRAAVRRRGFVDGLLACRAAPIVPWQTPLCAPEQANAGGARGDDRFLQFRTTRCCSIANRESLDLCAPASLSWEGRASPPGTRSPHDGKQDSWLADPGLGGCWTQAWGPSRGCSPPLFPHVARGSVCAAALDRAELPAPLNTPWAGRWKSFCLCGRPLPAVLIDYLTRCSTSRGLSGARHTDSDDQGRLGHSGGRVPYLCPAAPGQ
jgi:hypothetical protein